MGKEKSHEEKLLHEEQMETGQQRPLDIRNDGIDSYAKREKDILLSHLTTLIKTLITILTKMNSEAYA